MRKRLFILAGEVHHRLLLFLYGNAFPRHVWGWQSRALAGHRCKCVRHGHVLNVCSNGVLGVVDSVPFASPSHVRRKLPNYIRGYALLFIVNEFDGLIPGLLFLH